MRAFQLAAAALLAVLLVGPARAQSSDPGGPWSVQTVALRDLREAQATAAALKQSGFDAFTEFAMDNGLQFVRVRVGCYTTREAAEVMAAALRGRITDTAVVVEATPGAPVAGCVRMDVGFLKPFSWDEVELAGLAPAFRVVVAGIEAHVTHTGQRWRVLQDGEEVPLLDPALPLARFSQASVAGVALIRLDGPGGALLLCPGVLLNSVGRVAISEQEDALVACSLEIMGGA
ncbi:MAG: SPOR domain-containing protein [Trueperaceae bacterium]